MPNSIHFLTRTCLFACVFLAAISCKDTDDFLSPEGNTTTPEKEANTFDFSTTQEIDLIVDYSAFNAKIPVFFSVYNVNPFVNENKTDEYIDENIKPIFAAYTAPDGKYDKTVTLPAYARVLHIVTGNFLVGLRRNVVEIINGEARAIVENPLADAQQSRMTRAPWKVPGTGSSTNDLSKMHNLSWTINNDGSKNKQIYKDWVTPLGTWNSASGRPDYLLDKNDPALISKGLVFTEEEINGMYGTACDALNSGSNMKEQYRAASDLRLKTASEVSITAMGSSTCWNSSLGYYYYNESNPPQSRMDLNIIMLFPNTQDGEWPRGSYPNNNYKGNIGNYRGDAVQLMYYPNIASGDFSGATPIFPAGTKIGFILKANSWGCLGSNYSVNSCTSKINIWGSSTEGMSKSPTSGVNYPNPNGDARSAKFAYTAPNGNEYVVISFEDACDDKDYDDLMFALNPANAFDFSDVAQVESKKVTVEGVYGFEDKWPEEGDYDMNDLMIDCKHELEYYTHPDKSKKLVKERFYLTPYHNYITLKNGLAVNFEYTESDIATLYVYKIMPGEKDDPLTTDKMLNKMYYYLSEFTWSSSQKNLWYLTDDITKNEGATYVFEVTYKNAMETGNTKIKPFLWRKKGSKHLEVHLPYEEPTSNADKSLFGTAADRSNPNITNANGKKMYYVGSGSFPFAFYLEGVSIDAFKETVLKRENESLRIDNFFPEFLEWSISEGKKNSGWYLNMYVPQQ